MGAQEDVEAYTSSLKDYQAQALVSMGQLDAVTSKTTAYAMSLPKIFNDMKRAEEAQVISARKLQGANLSKISAMAKELSITRSMRATRMAELSVAKQQKTISEQQVKILRTGGPVAAMKGNMIALKSEMKDFKQMGNDLSHGRVGDAFGGVVDKMMTYTTGMQNGLMALYKDSTKSMLDAIGTTFGAKSKGIIETILSIFEFGRSYVTKSAQFKQATAGAKGLQSGTPINAGSMKGITDFAASFGEKADDFLEEMKKVGAAGRFDTSVDSLKQLTGDVKVFAMTTGQTSDSVIADMAAMKQQMMSRGATDSDVSNKYRQLIGYAKVFANRGLGNIQDLMGGVKGLVDSFHELNLDAIKTAKNTIMYGDALKKSGGNMKQLGKVMQEITNLGNIGQEWKGFIGLLTGKGTNFFGAQFGYEQRKGNKSVGESPDNLQQQKDAYAMMTQMTSGMVGEAQQGMMEMMGGQIGLSPQTVQLMQQAAEEGWSQQHLDDELKDMNDKAKENINDLNSFAKQIGTWIDTKIYTPLVKIESWMAKIAGGPMKWLMPGASKAIEGAEAAGTPSAEMKQEQSLPGQSVDYAKDLVGRTVGAVKDSATSFDDGGSVGRTGLAMVHAGEVVSTPGKGGRMTNNFYITVQNDARGIAKDIENKIIQAVYEQRQTMMGA